MVLSYLFCLILIFFLLDVDRKFGELDTIEKFIWQLSLSKLFIILIYILKFKKIFLVYTN